MKDCNKGNSDKELAHQLSFTYANKISEYEPVQYGESRVWYTKIHCQ